MKKLDKLFSITYEIIDQKIHMVIKILGIKMKFYKGDVVEEEIYNKNLVPKEGFIYEGNPEYGLCNMESRMRDTQGTLEFKDMVITNKVIGDRFIGEAKSVVNIGSGVGTFEWQNAKRFPDVKFVASEFEESQINWTKENRDIANVTYCSDDMKTLLDKYGKFDFAVTVDVIEHVENYKEFLDNFSKLSDRAVISTPNRDRWNTKEELVKPPFNQHTHEWNAGELYFILKMYYKNVKMYSFPEPYEEGLVEVGIYSHYEKLVAYCEN